VSDYGLDDRAIGVRSPAGAEDFSYSLFVQTGSETHPASCTMGIGGPYPGGEALPGRDADHSPHLVSRSSMNRIYNSSPPSAFMACSGTALALFLAALLAYEPHLQSLGISYFRERRGFINKGLRQVQPLPNVCTS
jgi:hypothetical protein